MEEEQTWARRQERARMNLKSFEFAAAVRTGKALMPKDRADLEQFRVNAPVRINKAVAPSLAGLIVRVIASTVKRAIKSVAAKTAALDTKALIAGAVVGETISQVVDGDLPDFVKDAGAGAKALMRESGERFGIGGSEEQQSMLRLLQPSTVAVYLGSKLLTVVSSEVAKIMLEGMKRNMRNRIRVR